MARDWIDEQYGTNAEWFRAARVADLERELAGAVANGNKEYAKNVRAELAAMGHGQSVAEKRPAARGSVKQTRA